MLEKIKIVLCQTSHPGNIGASARAMKNMGLYNLVLVSPENYPNAQATERASGADDILAKARVAPSLEEAVADCQWVYGTSARSRSFPWPQLTPVEGATQLLRQAAASESVAIVFGTERSGLSNEELQQCDYHLTIPTNPEYSSLNLSQAVQVIAYEIYKQATGKVETHIKEAPSFTDKASHGEIMDLIAHFEETAVLLGFMDPKHPKKLMPRLKRLFAKAQLEKDEINILRGFLKAAQMQIPKA